MLTVYFGINIFFFSLVKSITMLEKKLLPKDYFFFTCPLTNLKGTLFFVCFLLPKKDWTVGAKKYDNKSISHKHHQFCGNTGHGT